MSRLKFIKHHNKYYRVQGCNSTENKAADYCNQYLQESQAFSNFGFPIKNKLLMVVNNNLAVLFRNNRGQ